MRLLVRVSQYIGGRSEVHVQREFSHFQFTAILPRIEPHIHTQYLLSSFVRSSPITLPNISPRVLQVRPPFSSTTTTIMTTIPTPALHDLMTRSALAKHFPQIRHNRLWSLVRGKVASVLVLAFQHHGPHRARPRLRDYGKLLWKMRHA